MKKYYPDVNTLDVILKFLQSIGIKPTIHLQATIKQEIQTYKNLVMSIDGKPIIDKDPAPKEFIEATTGNTLEKVIIVFFENPYEYIEIVDQDGNPETDKSFLQVFEQIALVIYPESPEKTTLTIVPEETLKSAGSFGKSTLIN